MAAHSANIDVLVANDDTSDSAPCCPHGIIIIMCVCVCVGGGGVSYTVTPRTVAKNHRGHAFTHN